jgi:hypothetical protein
MANNIVPSTASFTTTNMKPANDEIINSLWGQNAADNTGFLYNALEDLVIGGFGHEYPRREVVYGGAFPYPNGSFNKDVGGFVKGDRHNTIHGSFVGKYYVLVSTFFTYSGTFAAYLYTGSNTLLGTLFEMGTTFTANGVTNFGTVINYSISGLTKGDFYRITTVGMLNNISEPDVGDSYTQFVDYAYCFLKT